jgi:hypothetical protein
MYHTKSSKPKSGGSMPKATKGYSYPCPAPDMKFNDRPIMSTNPMREQFEPTDASAIRQHKRMAGYQ